jgi:hypothetical protein
VLYLTKNQSEDICALPWLLVKKAVFTGFFLYLGSGFIRISSTICFIFDSGGVNAAFKIVSSFTNISISPVEYFYS